MISTKKIISLVLIAVFVMMYLCGSAQTYAGKNIHVSLFSSTPLENIRAASENGTAVLIAATREIVVQVPVKSLEFDRKLMQEHFNENYMESDRFPYAKFKGIINEQVDFAKDGEYDVTVNGILSVHGVDQKRSIPGKINIRAGVVQIGTAFTVACASHKIKIPTLVFTKIAEQISIKATGKLSLIKP
jgi:hypothetical protein